MTVSHAYSPASLSFVFKSCFHKDIFHSGSIGLGCTVNQGVIATVKKAAKTTIFFNERPVHLPTVMTVLDSLLSPPLIIKLQTNLPLGCGFGLSSACALSVCLAVNKLLQLNKNFQHLARIVHACEIQNKTGLGSVGTQITGGFLLKKKAGLPVNALSFPFFLGKKIYARVLGSLPTANILKNEKKINQVNQAADKAFTKINSLYKPTLEEILDISYEFAVGSQLLTGNLREMIDKMRKDGYHATMSMLGKVILTSFKPKIFKDNIFKFTITNDIARLTDEN